MTTIGFIGLGSMGLPMAGHILDKGVEGDTLTVTNMERDRADSLLERGAVWAESARQVAEASEVILVMVPAVPHVMAVLDGPDGLIAGTTTPTVVAISSTISPEAVREIARHVEEASGGLLHVVDTPVSGGEGGAKAGTLSLMVGGADDDVARVLPVLGRLGTPLHLGPLGSGLVAKACNQLICAATIVAVAEAAVVAERAGLDVGQLFGLLQGGYASSRILADKGPRYAAKDYSVSGAAWLWIKDLQAYLDEAGRTGTPTVQADRLLAAFEGLTEAGLGKLDTAVVQEWIARREA